MKVGYFVETPVEHNLTGGSRSFLNFVEVLKDKGVEPFVVVSEEWALTERLAELHIPYLCSKMYRPFVGIKDKAKFYRTKHLIKTIINGRAKRKAIYWFRDNGVQLVHINSQFAGIVGAQVAQALKVPYVYHIREFLDAGFGVKFYSDSLVREYIVPAERIIAISKSIQYFYERKFGRELQLVYNGIPINTATSCESMTRLNKPVVQLVIVGRVCEAKGQQEAVDALKILVKEWHCENLHMNIVGYQGTDPYEQNLKDYIGQQELDKYVTLHPFMKTPLEVSRFCDIGLTCSAAEAFGRVTVEYMLASLLTIGADTGGTTEIIEDGDSGLLYRQGNPRDLAAKIKWALDNKDAANDILIKGKERAATVFSINSTAENIYKIYKELIDKE